MCLPNYLALSIWIFCAKIVRVDRDSWGMKAKTNRHAFKLVKRYYQFSVVEFYNMINDLQGRNNLPESFEYEFILKKWETKLDKWMHFRGD